MTVHGEREMLPAVSKAEGTKALTHFTETFNKVNRQLDPTLNPSFEGGALLAIDQAGIKAAHALRPQGNPNFTSLAFTDPHFTVPKQAGWPKYFIADAASNRKNARGQNTRWFLVFSRNGIDEQWRAVYLATFAGNKAPELGDGQERLRGGGAGRREVRSGGRSGQAQPYLRGLPQHRQGQHLRLRPGDRRLAGPAGQGRQPARPAHPVGGHRRGLSAGGAADEGRRCAGVLLDRLPPAEDDVRRGDDHGDRRGCGACWTGRRRRPTGWPSPPSPARRSRCRPRAPGGRSRS